MNIEKIEISNFKGIEKLSYTPKNAISVLLGKNGAGKTSFIQALECIFGGKHNSKSFIRYGKTKAVISVTAAGTVFTRQISWNDKDHPYMLDGSKVTERDFRSWMADKAGISAEDFKALTSSKVFEAIDPQAFSEFLSNHIPEKIAFETLVSVLNEDAAFGGKFDANALKILKKELGENFEPNEFTGLYDGFYKERRTVNRELKAAKAKVENKLEKPEKSREDIEKEKEEIMKEEAEMAASEKIRKSYEGSLKAYESARAQKEKLEAEVRAAKCVKPDDGALAKLNSQMVAGQESVSKSESVIQVLQNNNALYQKTLDNLDKPVCPISEKLVCSTDKTELKAELQGMIAENNRAIQSENGRIDEFRKALEKIREKIAAFNTSKVAYEKYATLSAQLKDFKLPEKPAEPSSKAYDSKTEVRAAKIAERKIMVNEAYAAAVAYEKFQEDRKACDKIALKQKCYDALVKATDPKGAVIQALLTAYFEIFNKTCNEIAEKIKSPFTVEFVSDNGISLRCWKNKMACAYDGLSNGEKIIITYIVLDMLNQLTGNRMLFVDNLNELDGKSIMSFLNMLHRSDYYDHIILCSVDYEEITGALDMIEADYVL